ncbi:MAG TPA: hypothetical protein VLG50_01945 [Candidatus Saccharimonadales bacterium]|nr:hypothetical protein [Candidatus Saccharimonadales bacterium]
MGDIKNKDLVGYFLKRNDLYKLSAVDLLRELSNHLFEANIMKLTIQHFQKKNLSVLDSSVGDWKCQTRTSIILDLVQNATLLNSQLSDELNKIDNIIFNIEHLIHKINNLNSVELQNLSRQELQKLSLYAYQKKHQLNYEPSKELTKLSLCFLTTLSNNKLPVFTQHQMSVNKLKAVINAAKTMLCRLSINYEQTLANTYGTVDEKEALKQIEFKGMQYMTALFVGFKSIFKKMKAKQQPFINHKIIVCGCGGIQTIQNTFFAPHNNEFVETAMPSDLMQEVTVIEVYQFPGSLEQLQSILSVPSTKPDIPKEFYKSCECDQPTQQPKIESIEQAIMAFFAQHPQFTNGASIDWDGLGLTNSDLKKEYDDLCTLPGYSRNDMSKFWINHMYPSTIGHILEATSIQNLTSDPNFCGLSPDCLK